MLAIGFGIFLVVTAFRSMTERGIPFTFSFLFQEAGFTVSEGSLLAIEDGRLVWRPFTARDTYLQAFATGLYSTLRVTVVGILIATVTGVLLGVLRLSGNWLVNRLALAYVEVVRNTPLLVQMFFWYFAVLLKLPGGQQASTWYGGLIVSNQGAFLPWLVPTGPTGGFAAVIATALLLGAAAWLIARRLGRQRPVLTGIGSLLAVLGIGLVLSGLPFEVSTPELGRFRITGGIGLSPEFTAVLLGLVIYTSAFIAEVIRGAIQSIPRGQWEGAGSLGLRYFPMMWLIILPQAARIAIPPIGNLYLSLMKNTSLAVAVGYPDLFNIYRTISNQSGRSLEGVIITMIVYLVLSFIISALLNAYNRRVNLRWSA